MKRSCIHAPASNWGTIMIRVPPHPPHFVRHLPLKGKALPPRGFDFPSRGSCLRQQTDEVASRLRRKAAAAMKRSCIRAPCKQLGHHHDSRSTSSASLRSAPSPQGEGFDHRGRKSKTPPAATLAARGENSSRYHPVFARATSRWGPCRLRQRRCLQPDAVTGVPGAGLGQPPLAGATLRPCSASCSPPVSTIGALWLRQCQKLTLLFLVFVWFFVYVHHYSVATPLCQWVRSAKSSRHFTARAGHNS